MSVADKTTTISANNVTIAENEQKVYDAGKKSQYDEFWDNFQNNGKRTNYNTAFATGGWTNKTFRPKYSMSGGYFNSTFNGSWLSGDLVQHLSELGVSLDISKATYVNYLFYQVTGLTRVGVMNFSSASEVVGIFNGCKGLVTIDEFVCASENSYSMVFYNCIALENITISGTIAKNGFSVADSPNLTHDSLMSIINALYDYSEYTGTTTWKVTLGGTNTAKLTDEEIQIIKDKGWTYA